ncbi:hypothetical protein Q4601_04865 [Shewanella sp. 1_MG-2023]|uniref:hypothetical protein n=1 Tax=unclassified Shewanella TaxID=196818 RepID=UPI0026E1E01F|nr:MULTISPECIES: hypothetical protein [unclassified Shewanella]MDO6611549.1 hypothetical protein [Shewanella sp. 7_MG-2023]MDO6771404.1 hypothetical protein [Shewanella sp. 2_MG-2023]MDO6793630.1 hypothetical protein [Shewanella sp. 1_MG-2023]
MTFAKYVAVTILMAGLSINAYADNRAAMLEFDAKLRPIAQRSQLLSDMQVKLMDDFNQMAEAGKSASAVFNSGKVQQLQLLGNETLIEANLFVAEFEHFLAQLPETSTCYLPEKVTEYQGMITQLTQANKALSNVPEIADGDELGAAMALLNLQMHAGQLSSLVQMFQLVKTCYMPEAIGLSKEDVEQMKAQTEDADN